MSQRAFSCTPRAREQPLPAPRHRPDRDEHDRERGEEEAELRVREDVHGLAEVDLPDQVGDREPGHDERAGEPQHAAAREPAVWRSRSCGEGRVQPPQRRDHVRDVLIRMRGRERQREHLGARALGDGQRRLLREPLAVPGQPVHRQEVDRGRDPLAGERRLVGVPVGAGPLRVDPDDVEVARMGVARVALERRDPVELGQPLVVERELPRADRGVLVRPCRAGRARSRRAGRRGSPCSRARSTS